MTEPNKSGPWRLLGAGVEFAGAILVLAGLGYLFDRWAGTGPWGLVIGSMVGLAGGLYNLIRMAREANR